MHIQEIATQNRRDFTAIYICEHCGTKVLDRGYDDANFHQNVIPKMVCSECGRIAPDTYRPLTTKYREGEQA